MLVIVTMIKSSLCIYRWLDEFLFKDHGVQKSKRNQILSALEKDPVDVGMLRQLSISRGGLLDNNLRQKAWPLLLDIDIDNIPLKPSNIITDELKYLWNIFLI